VNKKALSGIKVLECAELISGPYCAKMLDDLGAEVLKVERPMVGDRSRHLGPFSQDIPHPEQSGLFLYLNTNKKGITLNLETTTGVRLFKELVERSDVLVENTTPGTLPDLGLGYDEIEKINPRLVMASITPFGQTGPYRRYMSSELVTFHMSGLGYETPRATERISPDRPPLKGGGHFAEFFAAVNAAAAIAAALYARRANGLGQYIDISAQESLIPLLRRPIALYQYEQRVASRLGYTWKVAPHHFMRCKDGYIFASVVEEHQWSRMVEVMGNPDWGRDDRFRDGPSRLEHWNVLEPLLGGWLLQRTKDEVLQETQAQGIPFAPVNTVKDLMDSPHLQARDFFAEVNDREDGPVTMPGVPYKFSVTPPLAPQPAPRLGEHNREVFCDLLGYSKCELVKLRETGII